MFAAGMDYTPVFRNLTFNAAVTSQMVEVPIIDDHIVEHSEIVSLTLMSTDSDVILNPSNSTITIEDVDSKLIISKHKCNFTFLYVLYTYVSMNSHSLLQWLQLDSTKQPIQ